MKQIILNILQKHSKSDLNENMIEIPPNSELGDYAFPCFILSKELKKSPIEISKELKNKIQLNKQIVKIEANGPYLNFYVNKGYLAEQTISKILKQKECYGAQKKKKEKVMIEYSQPNSHKAFHVGHIRGTSIGEALSRILTYNGYKVLQANYSGDTGAHIGKWLWNYLDKHNGEKPPKDSVEKWVADIYVEAVQRIVNNPELEEKSKEIIYKLENNKDPKLNKLWNKTKQWSVDAFNKIYNDLDAHFDYWFWESEMEDKGKEIVKELLKEHLAIISQGVPVMDLKQYNLGVWVLLRQDGTTLYSAKDLALANIKFNKYKIDKSIYVVANHQALHFQQLFKTLELMKFKQAKDCYHLSFEMVILPEGKMSSRTGQNILYTDMKEELLQYSLEETKKRHKDWNKKQAEKSANAITIAALKFQMLIQDENKIITFNLEKSLDFEGETGPYIQYVYARINSILNRIKNKSAKPNYNLLEKEEEINLIKKLNQFEESIIKSAELYKPSILARYTLELTQLFNKFYHSCPVLNNNKQLENSRLVLVKATKQVLEIALGLLAIKSLKQM